SNGSEESSQYDNLGRCLFKSTRRAMGRDWSRRYHWSGEGELQRVDINGIESVRYEYDAAHRLRRRIINGMAESYELDRADNLIAQPGLNGVSLKQGNRLEAANGSQFFYNDRNHIVTRQRGDNRIEYAYDSRDQLVRVETEEGVWEAEYDAIGRRVRKTWLGKTTEYYWNQDQLIAEVSPAGRLRLYVYANPLALTPLLIVDYHSINAPPESGECYCIFSDQIGSPCLVEDDQGTDVWRARIEPYGEAEIKSIKGFEFHFRFPGHYFDNEIGLHYNRFRYYDPGLGRYIQSDPWGLAGGYNLYGYFTNPLLQVDVQGLGEEGEDGCPPRENDAEGTPPPGSSGSQHAQSSLPAGAQSARDRIAQGKTVPPHVRYDPDGYYYDTKSSRYKSIPEPKPDFSQGPGNREIPCFCSGTLIATPGSFVRIENIKQGEIVSSWDADQQKVVEASVVALHKNRAVDWVEIVVCDEKITSTKKHRYWVRKYEKWIEARLLSVGMEVLLENGQYVPIDKLSFVKTQEKDTFNITVENTNTFYVGGSKVLVHNQGDDSNGKIYIGYNKDGIPIYVGQTKQTIKARQSQHRAEGVENPDSKGWKSDMEIKPVPGMDGLTDDQMDYHERRIHDELVNQGYDLKNSQIPMTDGKINKLVEKHC
ncbi:MAG: RHS repeat-associated core domain-containing protein, partial [Candidatus Thiodiazotropha sp.]